MSKTIKAHDWLATETERNKKYAPLYTAIIKKAYGCNEAVLIGHHLCFEHDNDISTEDEIPSADSLIFDHDIMRTVFGDNAASVISTLALSPVSVRDDMLLSAWNTLVGEPVDGVEELTPEQFITALTEEENKAIENGWIDPAGVVPADIALS